MRAVPYLLVGLFSVTALVLWWAVLFMGCRSVTPPPQADEEELSCRGPVDEGKVVWWGHTRYRCVDHGLAKHGFWWEAGL